MRRAVNRGLIKLFVFGLAVATAATTHPSDNIKAAYLTSAHLENPGKISYLLKLIEETELNAVVIDIKESAVFLKPRHIRPLCASRSAVFIPLAALLFFRIPFSRAKDRNWQ